MTDQAVDELIDAARRGQHHAHAPYSKFAVGAALRCSTGEVYTGVNVENASYGLTICAERVAVAKAVSEGHRGFDAMAIVLGGKGTPVPCGACCQVLAEFCPQDFPLYLVSNRGVAERRLSDLLPSPFRLGE